MTDEEEFERCWAVLWLKYSSLGMFEGKDPELYKKLFKVNWDSSGGLEWFNELSEMRHD
jgi:hypothetical protein